MTGPAAAAGRRGRLQQRWGAAAAEGEGAVRRLDPLAAGWACLVEQDKAWIKGQTLDHAWACRRAGDMASGHAAMDMGTAGGPGASLAAGWPIFGAGL